MTRQAEAAGRWVRAARRPLAGLLALVAAAGGLAACADDGDEFVRRAGRSFVLDGDPFRFVGFNLYDAAASDVYTCSPATRMTDDALDDALRWARDEAGASVIRFWAYQTYTAGGTDFSGVDRVVRAARRAGLRVIPVLEDGPGNCSTGVDRVAKSAVEGDTWYTQGYKRPYGDARLAYRDYVRVMAEHYRDEPTIMAWMMVNEAETEARNEGDRTALADFARDVAGVIREVDRRHLITLGTQGNGAPGTGGPDFRQIYEQDALDFAEVHDWARYGSDTEALPGSTGGSGGLPSPGDGECEGRDARIACSFAVAAELDKPLVVGEAGITASDGDDRRRRADLLAAKMDAAFAAGAAGYLVWHLSSAPTDGYDVVPADDDPVADVMDRWGDRLRR